MSAADNKDDSFGDMKCTKLQEDEAPDTAPHVQKTPPSCPSLRIFLMPDKHELVFDYFCGTPTLHIRPHSAEQQAIAAGDSQPPSSQDAFPFRMDCRSFNNKVLHAQVLFWVKAGENKHGIVCSHPRRFTSWSKFKLTLTIIGCLGSTIRTGADAPRCFPFYPDMVVVHIPPQREDVCGALVVTRRNYYMSLPTPKVVAQGIRKEIKELTPRTIIF